MKISVPLLVSVAIICAGCETIVVRPSNAPQCEIPSLLETHCSKFALPAIGEDTKYSDLATISISTVTAYANCKKALDALVDSYKACVATTAAFNKRVLELEQEMKEKHKNVRVSVDGK